MALLLKIELLLNGPIQKAVLLLKIESDTVTKNRTVIKRINQKTALLFKIESDTVTKNRRWYCY